VDPGRYHFVPASTWGEVLDGIRRYPVEMAIVDPMLGGKPRVQEIERFRVLFPSLPILLYTTLVPESAGILLTLGRAGIRRALFARVDDTPASIREALEAELERTASEQVLKIFAGALDGLPVRLRWAFESAMHVPADSLSVEELARRANLKRRTCERWFARSGLPSPRMMLVLARLLYAHRLLLDPGYTVEDVTLKLGYGRARTLQMHFKDVFGLTAGDMRISLTTEQAVAMVIGRYFTPRRQVAS
jgi:AraC-like DNA-binding protein